MSSERYECVGPDMAPSKEERTVAEEWSDILTDLPTLDLSEVAQRHGVRLHELLDPTNDKSDHFDQYRPHEHLLPGFGEEYEECGWQIPHVCEEHGHEQNIGRTCARSVCPRCGAAWVAKRAINIVARILSSAKMRDGSIKFQHVVFRPEQNQLLDSSDFHETNMRAITEMMETIDMEGVVLPHDYSGAGNGIREEHDDRGEWKKRLFSKLDWEEVRDELEHDPHYHVLGACEYFPADDTVTQVHEATKKKGEDDQGWLIHRTQSVDNVYELARAVTYALSHTSIDTRGDQNQYRRKKTGWAYHAASGEYHEQNERKARKAVHKVIGDTLGIEWTEVGCHEKVDPDPADHDLADELEGDGDGDGDGDDADDADTKTNCHGGLVSLDRAEFVEDPTWVEQAPHGEEARERRRRWKEAGGWEGWVERGGDPPPG